MTVCHVVGIDPGLVHTGLVCIRLDENLNLRTVGFVIDGLDAEAAGRWVAALGEPQVYIEKYRPRANYGTDERMVKAERDFKKAMPGSVLLQNTGIKQMVTRELLERMGLWSFTTPTHHQDLRSAARIAVLGMLKDDSMNAVLARWLEAVILNEDAAS